MVVLTGIKLGQHHRGLIVQRFPENMRVFLFEAQHDQERIKEFGALTCAPFLSPSRDQDTSRSYASLSLAYARHKPKSCGSKFMERLSSVRQLLRTLSPEEQYAALGWNSRHVYTLSHYRQKYPAPTLRQRFFVWNLIGSRAYYNSSTSRTLLQRVVESPTSFVLQWTALLIFS